MNDDKYIREIFKNIKEDIQPDLEETILQQIGKEQDHSVVLRKYKLFSKIGLFLSILLAFLITMIYLYPLLSGAIMIKEDNQTNMLPTVYAVLILLFLYIQIEVYKSSRI